MNESISRRKFISLSTGGIITAALSPVILSPHNALAALPPDDDDAIEPMGVSGSWFTSTNPLPSGRTWNMSKRQDTIDVDSIPLDNTWKAIAAAKVAAKLASRVPQLKTYAAIVDVSADLISLAVAAGYGDSRKISTRTKVYYPNGGRRISADGATPVRYVEKHVTHYYGKENQSGSLNKTTIRYKIIEVG